MAADADMVLYDQEMIQAFRRQKALLRDRVTTRGMVKGGSFVFDVYGSRTDTAVTRGATGDIPYAQTNQTQVTVTLEQWHAAKEKNGFNIFKSQGDQKRAMQEDVVGIANRKMDQQIIDALAAATTVNSVAQKATPDFCITAVVNLLNNDAAEGMVSGVITPSFWGNLVKAKEISSKDYVDTSMFPDRPTMFRWLGAEWLVHSGLTGVGTASATCFLFHKAAIGYGLDTAGIKNEADYESKHDRSWARSTFYGNAKLLQNTGIIKMLHDDTGHTIS